MIIVGGDVYIFSKAAAMFANSSDGDVGVLAATFCMVVRSYWFARLHRQKGDCQIQKKRGLSVARLL